jgi:hypothetical protein
VTRTFFLAAVAAAALAAPSVAQTPFRVAAFDSLRLVGGGEIILRYGAEQRVTLLSGDPAVAAIEVGRDGDLVIRPCRRSCNQRNFRVEVVTPSIDAVAITGGGRIRSQSGFPARASIALAVTGGGDLDARALPAASVVAAVQGGGRIATTAERSLVSAVNGGGAIVFRGDPSRTTTINGGGSVTRER